MFVTGSSEYWGTQHVQGTEGTHYPGLQEECKRLMAKDGGRMEGIPLDGLYNNTQCIPQQHNQSKGNIGVYTIEVLYWYCTGLKCTTFMSHNEMILPKELPYTYRMDIISMAHILKIV